MFSIKKLVTKSIIYPDLARSVSFARCKSLGYENYYQRGRKQSFSGPTPDHKPVYKFYDNPYPFHHRRGGLRPKVIIGTIVLGLIVWKYVHSHKNQNHCPREKGSSQYGKSNDSPNSLVQEENGSSKT